MMGKAPRSGLVAAALAKNAGARNPEYKMTSSCLRVCSILIAASPFPRSFDGRLENLGQSLGYPLFITGLQRVRSDRDDVRRIGRRALLLRLRIGRPHQFASHAVIDFDVRIAAAESVDALLLGQPESRFVPVHCKVWYFVALLAVIDFGVDSGKRVYGFGDDVQARLPHTAVGCIIAF